MKARPFSLQLMLCGILAACAPGSAPPPEVALIFNAPSAATAYSPRLSKQKTVSPLPNNLPPPGMTTARACAVSSARPTDTSAIVRPYLFKNLGSLTHKVSTAHPQAQAFFDQGLRLIYGFNHAEAYRSFTEAARLDPNCAMAYWGQALAMAPNINLPTDKERAATGYAAIRQAMALRAGVSAPEQAYIEAMALRFAPEEPAQRHALDSAYAAAMHRLSEAYPNDPDAGTLAADALMNRMPWDYWAKDGQPKPGIGEAIAGIESILKRYPNHPGAHHLYIHLVEASANPDRGIPSADRLGKLMPGAGHLVHMPSHIYVRVGRYADAAESNRQAAKVDEQYIAQCGVQGMYPLGYYPHNIHFLWLALTMEGKSQEAIAAAHRTADKVPLEQMAAIPMLQTFYTLPLYSYVRFGKWNEILTEPNPGRELRHADAVWHFARGKAYVAKGLLQRAENEMRILDSLRKDSTLAKIFASQNPTARVVDVAYHTLAGEIAAKKGNYPEAIRLLREGVRLEDDLRYDEPPSWPLPVRHTLGAVLLEAGQAKEAELVYREDLKIHRNNGWSLFGLHRSMHMQGNAAGATSIGNQFKKAWATADVAIQASRY